jgi:hypothetical protein
MQKVFEFFEIVADELSVQESRVLTRKDLQLNQENAPLLDELKDELDVETTEEAIREGVDYLAQHFRSKGSSLPFAYDEPTARFEATDVPFLQFIKDTKNIRSLREQAKNFELSVLQRLGERTTGALHRVGFPRDRKKSRDEFNTYLKKLGFNGNVLLGQEKDGGFDILWELPIGAVPHRPIVSVQCKNGEFDIEVAHQSVGNAGISLGQHRGLQAHVHIPCVLFNDYIYSDVLTPKQLNFVPLGLSDLSRPVGPVSLEAI